MQRLHLFLFLSTILFGISCGHRPNNSTAAFSTSFEGERPFESWINDQHCCNYSVQQSGERYTHGRSSLRLEVRHRDPMTSRAIRAELAKDPEPMNVERRYSFKMYLQNWQFDNAGESVFQWHPNNLTGTATASLWTSGGRYIFQTNTGGKNYYINLGKVISDEWVSWEIHVRWSGDTTGFIKLWKNGELMIDRRNIVTSPPEGCYFKLGINKFGWGTEKSTVERRVVFFDEVLIL